MEKLEEKLLETRTYTPVTKETFEKFFKEFYAKNCKKDKQKLDQEGRISGREFFMHLKQNKNLENQQEEDEEDIPLEDSKTNTKPVNTTKEAKGDQIYYDENAFTDNLDDIDFDDEEDDEDFRKNIKREYEEDDEEDY